MAQLSNRERWKYYWQNKERIIKQLEKEMSEEMGKINQLTTPQDTSLEYPAMRVQQLKQQMDIIAEYMKSILKHDRDGSGKGDYGIIPGTPKPTLYKSGAEKLCLGLHLAAKIDKETIIDLPNGHREYRIITGLYNKMTGRFMGSGIGSCSTMESKHRYRNALRKCPACGKEAIAKGKEEYGGGWYCNKKKDGCGKKYTNDDSTIVNQKAGHVENENPADQYNTCYKVAGKRSYVDATIKTTAASHLFTADMEEDTDKNRDKSKEVVTDTDFEDYMNEEPEPPENDKPITTEQRKKMFALMDEAEVEPDEVKKFCNVESSKDIKQSIYDELLHWLEKRKGENIKNGDQSITREQADQILERCHGSELIPQIESHFQCAFADLKQNQLQEVFNFIDSLKAGERAQTAPDGSPDAYLTELQAMNIRMHIKGDEETEKKIIKKFSQKDSLIQIVQGDLPKVYQWIDDSTKTGKSTKTGQQSLV